MWSAACGTVSWVDADTTSDELDPHYREDLLDQFYWPPTDFLGPNGEQGFGSCPLIEGYCVPRSFRARLYIVELDYTPILEFSCCGWDERNVVERGIRARSLEEAPNPRGRLPWSEFERVALAWVATPADEPFEEKFGQSFDVVYPRLRYTRSSRVDEATIRKAAAVFASLDEDERRRLLAVAGALHVSESTAKRYLAEARKRGLISA